MAHLRIDGVYVRKVEPVMRLASHPELLKRFAATVPNQEVAEVRLSAVLQSDDVTIVAGGVTMASYLEQQNSRCRISL